MRRLACILIALLTIASALTATEAAPKATLKTVLGTDDMAAFKAAWEKYVLKLRFR